MMYRFTKSILFTFLLFTLFSAYTYGQGNITIGFYIDANCNGTKQAGEPYITGPNTPTLIDLITSLPYPVPPVPVGNQWEWTAVPAGDFEIQWENPSNGWILKTPVSGITSLTGANTHGAANQVFDAAYYEEARLEHFAWHDLDGDGVQDGGEPGLAGLTVTMTGTSCSAAAVNVTATDMGGGIYEFTNIEPSNAAGYTINFSALGGYERTSPNETGDTQDSDPIQATGNVTNVVILSGDDITNIDAGYWQFATISDFVWEDLNGNGQQDAEPGINGVTVNLSGTDGAGNGVALSDVTAAGGLYEFNNVPPGTNYTIEFVEPSANHFITRQDQGADATDSDANQATGLVTGVSVMSGDVIDDIDAGMYEGADIGNFVWEDLNGNGIQNGGEPGFAGVTVSLTGTDGAGFPVARPNIVTPGSGAYLFTDLPPGDYIITFGPALPANTFFTDPDQGGDDNLDSDADIVTGAAPLQAIVSGDIILHIDAGVFRGATISNFVWEDVNGNGIQDGGEPGLDGVPITIETSAGGAVTLGDGTPAPALVSGPAGAYIFDKLKPGMYVVTFGAFPMFFRTITGAGTAATDSDADPLTGETPVVTVISNQVDNTIDAGYFEGCRVADVTWLDLNGNGLQDGGEGGLDGVTVTLTNNVGAAVTDANNVAVGPTVSAGGQYEFVDLKPGMYRVEFTPPGGHFPTRLNAAGGAGDAADAPNDSDCNQAMGNQSHIFELLSGEDEEDIDAGFYEPVEIGDFVWHDQDANGIQDGGEPGQPGVTVMIANADGSPLTDVNNVAIPNEVTDAGGMYLFTDLRPGLYRLTVTPPAMWVFSIPNNTGDAADSDFTPGSGVITSDVQINSGSAPNLDIDAGVYKNITLCGTIWGDGNDNGTLEMPPADGIFPMVTVLLTGTAGDGTAQNLTAVTDPTGTYCFDVKPGDYVISIPPSMFGAGPLSTLVSCDGQADADSDVDNDDNGAGEAPTTSTTIMVRCGLEPEDMGTTNTTVDFCFKFDCDAPNPFAALSCETITDTFCDLSILNGFCARMPSGPPLAPFPEPLCPGGGFVSNNMSWFAFIAGDDAVPYSITVTPFDCIPAQAGGQPDVQMGIYTDCSFSDAVYCNGTCGGGPTPETIPSTGLIPGNTYFFFIDGCSGTVCSYEVDVSGFVEYIIPEPETIECTTAGGMCTPICPGNTVTLEVQPAAPDNYDNAVLKFVWRVTAPNGTITTILTDENEIPNYLLDQLGTWKFEIISVGNKCNQTSTIIEYNILVRNPVDEDFGTISLCEAFIPSGVATELSDDDPNMDGFLGWGNAGYAFVGGPPPGALNSFAFVGPPGTQQSGCMYNQTVRIIRKLNSPPGAARVVVCEGEAVEVGAPFFFTASGNIDNLLLSNMGGAANGCDTSVLVNSLELRSDFGEVINLGCSNGRTCFLLQNETLPTPPPGFGPLTVLYRWRRVETGNLVNDGNPDGNPKTMCLTIPGDYICEIVMTVNGKTCVKEYPFNFEPASVLPTPTPFNWNTNFCSSTLTTIYEATSTEANPQWNWTYPAGVTVSGQNSNRLTVTWGNVLGGEICVSIQDNCGESAPYCQTITITRNPVSSFTLSDEICIDSIAKAIFNGVPKYPNAIYNWTLDGGSIVSAAGTNGKDSIAIKWATSGKKYVTLTVVNPGPLGLQCPSNVYRDSVIVTPVQNPPLIDCEADPTQLVFTWTPLPGQVGDPVITVTPNTVSGTITGNSYTITGLPINFSVDISATFNNNHACGTITATAGCVTQDCTEEDLTFNTPAEICLVPNSPTVDLRPLAIPSVTTNGTFVFQGPGVAVGSSIFDPNVAGIGSHMVTCRYTDVLGCRTPTRSITIVVKEVPGSDFVVDPIICQDSLSIMQYIGNGGGASFDWDFGTDVSQSGANAGPFGVGWSTTGSKTITLQVTKDGCVSNITSKNVNVQARVDSITLTCPTIGATNLTFDWNDVTNISGYQLILNGASIATPSTSQLVLTGLPTRESYELIVNAISNTACPGKSDTLTCITDDCPKLFTKFSIRDTTLCNITNAPSFPINIALTGGLQSSNQVITWSGPGITQNPANDKQATFNPNVAGLGVHTIRMSLVDGTCSKDTTMRITIVARPTSTFTGLAKHCIDDDYIVTFSGTAGATKRWILPSNVTVSPVSGQPTQFLVNFPSAGTYTIGLETTSGSCISDITNVNVVVDPSLIAPIVTCSQTTTNVTFNWNDIECATQYRVSINGTNIGTQSTLSYAANNLMVGDVVTIIVTPISTCACPAVPTTLTCQAKECPPIAVTASIPNSKFCIGSVSTPIQLGVATSGGDGTGNGSWAGPNVNPAGSINPIGLPAGTYQYIYTFNEQSCRYYDTVSMTIDALPTLAVATVDPTCFRSNVGSVTATTNGGLAPYTFRIDNITVTQPFGAQAPGAHSMVVTDANGCTATSAYSITGATSPTLALTASAQNVLVGQIVNLTATFTGLQGTVDSIVWKDSQGKIVCSGSLATCSQLSITASVDETYCATVYFNGDCDVQQCISIVVKKVVVITFPNIINTNNPGNSTFFVANYESVAIVKEMDIYDRWGNLMFTARDVPTGDPSKGWDGKLNAKSVATGVYVYKIKLELIDGKIEDFKGDLTVIE